ncbi:MAG TPA: pitrilysin family protein [Dehalococcoidales bacterium]|nr:pitrilysin family protein [Dehalococcoidales bacterium]
MYRKTVLENGLRIITSPMPHTRSVSVCIYIGVGSRYEADDTAGVSHFIEHLCFKGTPKRAQARDIATAIEGVGGILNGGTDKELTIYWSKVAAPHFPLALDVLGDMLLNSKFDPEEIERERQVIIDEIHMIKDSPSQSVGMLIDELLWPNHPLGRDIAGNTDSVATISRDVMLDFLARRYHPGNTVVAVAGDIRHEDVVQQIGETLGHWTGREPQTGYLAYQGEENPRLRLEKRDTEQTHLCLALPGLPLLHPRRYTLGLLNVILGEGMSSRLFVEIRDNLGLAYSVHSYVEHFHDSGALTVYAGVAHQNLAVAIRAIMEQLAKLKDPVSESELTKARELAKGRLLMRMEDSRSVAGWTGGQEVLNGRILSVDQVTSILDAVTAEEISRLAQELLVGSRLRLAVVGPGTGEDNLEELLQL